MRDNPRNNLRGLQDKKSGEAEEEEKKGRWKRKRKKSQKAEKRTRSIYLPFIIYYMMDGYNQIKSNQIEEDLIKIR